MTDEEFDNYLDAAIDELDMKHASIIDEYGIGDHSDFVVDYEKQLLTFFENKKPVVEVTIIPIATHDQVKESLVWFWSNQDWPAEVRKAGETIKKLHEITGSELFITDSVECGEKMAWEIAALICKGFNSKGVYCMPHENLNAYVLIQDIKHS